METIIFAAGPDSREHIIRCQNWGVGQGYPLAPVVEGDWAALVAQCHTGMALVVATIGDCPSVGDLLDLLRAVPMFLVTLDENIETMPFSQAGAAQGRLLEGLVKMVADEAMSSTQEEVVTAFPAMTGKQIKTVTAIVKAQVGDPIQDEAVTVAVATVAETLKIPAGQAADWVKTVLEGGRK